MLGVGRSNTMYARRAHYPNMQIIQFSSSNTILVYYYTLQFFWLDMSDLSSYKPSLAYRESFLKLTQWHNQRVSVHISYMAFITSNFFTH